MLFYSSYLLVGRYFILHWPLKFITGCLLIYILISYSIFIVMVIKFKFRFPQNVVDVLLFKNNLCSKRHTCSAMRYWAAPRN